MTVSRVARRTEPQEGLGAALKELRLERGLAKRNLRIALLCIPLGSLISRAGARTRPGAPSGGWPRRWAFRSEPWPSERRTSRLRSHAFVGRWHCSEDPWLHVGVEPPRDTGPTVRALNAGSDGRNRIRACNPSSWIAFSKTVKVR